MRRDCKLILKILRYVRDNADGSSPLEPPDCKAYSPEIVAYHVRLCEQAGFVTMSERGDLLESPPPGILELTWLGQEKLDRHSE